MNKYKDKSGTKDEQKAAQGNEEERRQIVHPFVN
jgi:hypothetical protein